MHPATQPQAMTVTQIRQQVSWRPNWSLIFTIASFVVGFTLNGFINYMNYANKVDLLTVELTKLTGIVGEMNKKLDDSNEKYHDLDKRITVNETKIADLELKKK